jgi:hypothetical protein
MLKGLENFNTGTPYTYKIALYNALADLGDATTAYTTTNEVTGTGYAAGGVVLTLRQYFQIQKIIQLTYHLLTSHGPQQILLVGVL